MLFCYHPFPSISAWICFSLVNGFHHSTDSEGGRIGHFVWKEALSLYLFKTVHSRLVLHLEKSPILGLQISESTTHQNMMFHSPCLTISAPKETTSPKETTFKEGSSPCTGRAFETVLQLHT